MSPRPAEYPEVVVLTPGIFNSAYFEHSFLAQRMGAELVEGGDLVVEKDRVFMRTIDGLSQVDVIYRRIGDLFLDPSVFNKESVLGVTGLFRSWVKGNVALANAPGAGVADDKIIYTFVPKIIKYYLDEDPILPNITSYICIDKVQRQHVLQNLDKLVIKPANESGGYGILIGPQSTKQQRAEFARRIKADPRNYMAQPLIALSTLPVLGDRVVEPRHVDLRPFVLQADKSYVTAGGLTRVAMTKGSYIVNSSQGGGSKDTWIVGDD
ncbi:MAG: circularly permuted type 2 ATP-grasp protein [Proteobacteria bacterium]|nr:circularly permuted type 2 ATP-grasp protein [Pseudomonadota bacterium]